MQQNHIFGIESVLREAKTMACFYHHTNIFTVRDFYKENSPALMVMSHIEGLSLLDYLVRQGGLLYFCCTKRVWK